METQANRGDDVRQIVGFSELASQVHAMVPDAKGFDAAAWLSRWLTEPLPAFGGIRPIDLMDTEEGRSMVSTALAQIQSGAYA